MLRAQAATVLLPCLAVLCGALVVACAPKEDLDAPWTEEELRTIASLVLTEPVRKVPSPRNAVADDPRAVALGRALFFDSGLSDDGTRSCASCHLPERYFQDAERRARGNGGRLLPRNTPTVIGAAAYGFLNWDGRRDSLWSQAMGPLEAPDELGATRTDLARRIATSHRDAYESIFGPLPPVEDTQRFPPRATPVEAPERSAERARWAAMSEADRHLVDEVVLNAARALEAYQRTLMPRLSPFDAYAQALLAGDPRGGGHLSPGARRGLRLFIGRGGCVECHRGPLFTDGEFHNLGLPRAGGLTQPDWGRRDGARLVKSDPLRCLDCDAVTLLDETFMDFEGAFRTPSLRNVAETGPYMHGGQLLTLKDVVEFYKRLPGQAQVGHRDVRLKRLGSAFPERDLVLFLRALTGPLPEGATPPESTAARR